MTGKQTLALIGAAGETGSAMAWRLAPHYRLLLVDQEASSTEALKNALVRDVSGADVEVPGCPTESCWEADLIILTTPAAEWNFVSGKMQSVANRKTVVVMAHSHEEEAVKDFRQSLPYAFVVMAVADDYSCRLYSEHNEALEESRQCLEAAGYTIQATSSFFIKN